MSLKKVIVSLLITLSSAAAVSYADTCSATLNMTGGTSALLWQNNRPSTIWCTDSNKNTQNCQLSSTTLMNITDPGKKFTATLSGVAAANNNIYCYYDMKFYDTNYAQTGVPAGKITMAYQVVGVTPDHSSPSYWNNNYCKVNLQNPDPTTCPFNKVSA